MSVSNDVKRALVLFGFYGTLVFFVIALPNILFYEVNAFSMCFNNLFPTLEDVEKNVFFEFPASASHIEYGAEFQNYCVMWANFQMETSELETFLSTTSVSDLNRFLSDENVTHTTCGTGFDLPEQAAFGNGTPEVHPMLYARQSIFVDSDNSLMVDVYICTARTVLDL